MISNLRNLHARRELLRELVASELRTTTAETALGWLWWLVDPLIMMLIYWGLVAGLFDHGASYAPYPVFILCAILAWKHLATSVASSVNVLRTKEPLIKSVPFPTMILPITVVLSRFVYFLFGLGVLIVAAVVWPNAHHGGRWLAAVQIVPLALAQLVIVGGLSLAVACFGVLLRDLGLFVQHALRAGFFISPSLFGVDLVQSRLETAFDGPAASILFLVYMLNPFAVLITGYRDALFYGAVMPGQWWILLALQTLVFGAVGYRIYQHYDRRVIKFI